jgi:transketolase
VFFSSQGFDVQVVDGHDEIALEQALLKAAKPSRAKPVAILAKTVKGKGVSFMENNNSWHYTRLSPEAFGRAKSELGAV